MFLQPVAFAFDLNSKWTPYRASLVRNDGENARTWVLSNIAEISNSVILRL